MLMQAQHLRTSTLRDQLCADPSRDLFSSGFRHYDQGSSGEYLDSAPLHWRTAWIYIAQRRQEIANSLQS
ncbi:hypothetical protein BRADI_5g21925v3 [Brachypodium distachyon]|uniref:Uncharacterized protein n=1 Tax=Brachypodium distachyon TaxID=15368 RepID=A0A0Q3EDU7_BRADI|nr:hypothetical protein BRADI_5g21925v3 [Brachypodium distachyon]